MQYAHFKNADSEAINQFLAEHSNSRSLDFVNEDVCMTFEDPHIGATKESLLTCEGAASRSRRRAERPPREIPLNLKRGGADKQTQTEAKLSQTEDNLEVTTTRTPDSRNDSGGQSRNLYPVTRMKPLSRAYQQHSRLNDKLRRHFFVMEYTGRTQDHEVIPKYEGAAAAMDTDPTYLG